MAAEIKDAELLEDVKQGDRLQKINKAKEKSLKRYSKGNIPINPTLMNKYKNITELMSKNVSNYGGEVDIIDEITEFSNVISKKNIL